MPHASYYSEKILPYLKVHMFKRDNLVTVNMAAAGDKKSSRNVTLTLSADQVKEVTEAFKNCANKHGNIDVKKLGSVFRSLGQNPSDDEIQQLVNETDLDGNGVIDLDEFLLMMAKTYAAKDYEEEIRESYRVFDREKKGYIHTSDLRLIYEAIKVDPKTSGMIEQFEIDEVIKAMDADGNGVIDYQEFTDMISKEPDKKNNVTKVKLDFGCKMNPHKKVATRKAELKQL